MWKALSRNAASCNAVAIFATGMQLETIGLDDVWIAAIPEPHEWAMMPTGLALVGTIARNRRNRATRQP